MISDLRKYGLCPLQMGPSPTMVATWLVILPEIPSNILHLLHYLLLVMMTMMIDGVKVIVLVACVGICWK